MVSCCTQALAGWAADSAAVAGLALELLNELKNVEASMCLTMRDTQEHV